MLINVMFLKQKHLLPESWHEIPTSKMELLIYDNTELTLNWKLPLQITLSFLLVEVLDLLLAMYDFLICYTAASIERNITYWTIS